MTLNASIYSRIFERTFPDYGPRPILAPPGNSTFLPGQATNIVPDTPPAPAPQMPPTGMSDVDRAMADSQGQPPIDLTPYQPPAEDQVANYPQGDARSDLAAPGMDRPTYTPTRDDIDNAKRAIAGKKPREEMPTFEGSPAEIKLKQAEWQHEHPQDKDKGFKARLGEIINNFLVGMSHTPPGASVKQALLLGGVGAGAGLVDRTANERRELEQQIPGLRKQVSFETSQRNVESEIEARRAQARLDITKEDYAKLSDAAKYALDKYKAMPRYKKGENPLLDAELAKGGSFADKEPNDSLSFHVGPDGHPVVFNNRTGEYKIGKEDLSKPPPPPTITDKELPDEVFGLRSEKEINDMATGQVAKGMPTKAVRPEILAQLPDSVKTNGQFDMTKFVEQKSNLLGDQLKGVDLSQIIGDLPDNSQQRVAAAAEKIRKQQDALRREVPIFRGILSDNRPVPDAKPVPRTKIIDLFNQIMSIPNAKERKKKLDTFYAGLPNIRVQ